MPFISISSRTQMAAAACVLLAGCAGFSPDGGMDAVSALTTERIGQSVQFEKTRDPQAHAKAVARLLAEPLTADSAMQIALLNKPGLQAALAELGVAEADLVQAGRIGNPGFSFARMRGGEDVEIERMIGFDLLGLLTIPLRSRIEGARFEQAKVQAAAAAVDTALAARKAYFDAVAAEQGAGYMRQVAEAAEASAELGRRMAAVGNWSRLDQAREQVFYADAVAQVARARHRAQAAREQLVRALGLQDEQVQLRLPQRLPDLPPAQEVVREEQDVARLALVQRLDLQVARHDAAATAHALGLTRRTGLVNVLHAGYANKSETGQPRANGYEIEIALPLFDWGQARNARAEAVYMQAVHRTADVAVRARSEVREAVSAYRTAYDLAAHYRDEVVPLRKQISEEMVLRYNGMLIGVFELLADARTQIASVNAAIEAQRDFWIAESDLRMAIGGSGGRGIEMRAADVAGPAGGH